MPTPTSHDLYSALYTFIKEKEQPGPNQESSLAHWLETNRTLLLPPTATLLTRAQEVELYIQSLLLTIQLSSKDVAVSVEKLTHYQTLMKMFQITFCQQQFADTPPTSSPTTGKKRSSSSDTPSDATAAAALPLFNHDSTKQQIVLSSGKRFCYLQIQAFFRFMEYFCAKHSLAPPSLDYERGKSHPAYITYKSMDDNAIHSACATLNSNEPLCKSILVNYRQFLRETPTITPPASLPATPSSRSSLLTPPTSTHHPRPDSNPQLEILPDSSVVKFPYSVHLYNVKPDNFAYLLNTMTIKERTKPNKKKPYINFTVQKTEIRDAFKLTFSSNPYNKGLISRFLSPFIELLNENDVLRQLVFASQSIEKEPMLQEDSPSFNAIKERFSTLVDPQMHYFHMNDATTSGSLTQGLSVSSMQ